MQNTQATPQEAVEQYMHSITEPNELPTALNKWIAREDAQFVGAHLAYLPRYTYMRDRHPHGFLKWKRLIDSFMDALKEYWAVHHWQLLVDSGFFKAMSLYFYQYALTHAYSIPLEGFCIMLRSREYQNPSMDLLHKKAAERGSADTVAAYIYSGGLNPYQLTTKKTKLCPKGKLALDVTTSSDTKAVLKKAMNKVASNAMVALGIVFQRKAVPNPLMRECLTYLDLKGKDFVPLSPSDHQK
jgi:hypothetical protein